MNQAAKELLDELTQAMERMPNNPQGLAGWLLSNYHFRKVGSAEPIERFHTKSQNKRRNSDGSEEYNLKVAHNPVQELLKRTDSYKNIQATQAKLRGQNPQLAQMAAGIASVDEDMYGSGLPDSHLDVEEYDEDDEEIVRGPRLSRQLATGASLIDAKAAPLTAEELAELSDTVHEENDPEAASRALQVQRLKRLRAQQEIASGGGVGVFRRSG